LPPPVLPDPLVLADALVLPLPVLPDPLALLPELLPLESRRQPVTVMF